MARQSIGEFLHEQRRTARLSLRQLADLTGVSNPYLSQIERGLRRPSADVLQQIAKALRISSQALYVRAGLLDHVGDHPVDEPERDPSGSNVEAAVLADPVLDQRQKQALLDVYASFVAAHQTNRHDSYRAGQPPTQQKTPTKAAQKKTARGKPVQKTDSPPPGSPKPGRPTER